MPAMLVAIHPHPDRAGSARQVARQALLLCSLASVSAAAEMRCGQSLVERGFTPIEVYERCGPPQVEMQWTDYRYPGIWLRIDEWTYHLGTNKFRRLLTFENGRLIRIELREKPKLPET